MNASVDATVCGRKIHLKINSYPERRDRKLYKSKCTTAVRECIGAQTQRPYCLDCRLGRSCRLNGLFYQRLTSFVFVPYRNEHLLFLGEVFLKRNQREISRKECFGGHYYNGRLFVIVQLILLPDISRTRVHRCCCYRLLTFNHYT
jgi:hypothetical protein